MHFRIALLVWRHELRVCLLTYNIHNIPCCINFCFTSIGPQQWAAQRSHQCCFHTIQYPLTLDLCSWGRPTFARCLVTLLVYSWEKLANILRVKDYFKLTLNSCYIQIVSGVTCSVYFGFFKRDTVCFFPFLWPRRSYNGRPREDLY